MDWQEKVIKILIMSLCIFAVALMIGLILALAGVFDLCPVGEATQFPKIIILPSNMSMLY